MIVSSIVEKVLLVSSCLSDEEVFLVTEICKVNASLPYLS